MDIKKRIRELLDEDLKANFKIGDKVIYINKAGTAEIKIIDKISPAGNPIVNGKTFLKSSGSELKKKFDGDHIQPFNQKHFDDIKTLEKKFRDMGLGENTQTENNIVKQVRDAWDLQREKHFNKEYPIAVTINGIKRFFLVHQKTVSRLARLGEGESKLFLKTLIMGRMLKGDEPEPLWQFFEITEKNVFKNGAVSKPASKDEVEYFKSLK